MTPPTFPAHWTVRRARDAYLAENGFTEAAYDAKWTWGSIFGLRLALPNTRSHRWAIMLHDLHHVATGYGTDLAGEAEISAWELRHGRRGLSAYVLLIIVAAALSGALFAPRRTFSAWRQDESTRARRGRALFAAYPSANPEAYEALLDLTVGELRERLGVPAEGLARGPRGLHTYAPCPAVAR